jgi:hypothetical protein
MNNRIKKIAGKGKVAENCSVCTDYRYFGSHRLFFDLAIIFQQSSISKEPWTFLAKGATKLFIELC